MNISQAEISLYKADWSPFLCVCVCEREVGGYNHGSFLNIISQIGLYSGSSFPAANGKIKVPCPLWSQREEAAKWTLRSGFNVMSVFLSSHHQSREVEEHELLCTTWGLIGPLIPYQVRAHFSSSELTEWPSNVIVSKRSVEALDVPGLLELCAPDRCV